MKTLKTPLSYYGGKQSLLGRILPLIPTHEIYVEPFAGGGAVYFAKTPAPYECINDLNGHIVTFYKVLKSNFPILRKLIQETISSRAIHRKCKFILDNAQFHNEIEVAWAVWVQTNMSFSAKIGAGYGYGRSVTCVRKIVNKKLKFGKHLLKRIEFTDIECNDALKVIKSRDSESAFIYADPPYFNSDCGHYKGYTENDFNDLLLTLSEIKGKFLLSSYDSDLLERYVSEHGWYQIKIEKAVAISSKVTKSKIEVLTANFPI